MAHLDVLSGPTKGERIPLDGDRIVLGRHPACDTVLDMLSVSRQHAAVGRSDVGYWIEDLGSRNGTFVNGERLTGRRPLIDGDLIVICEMRMAFANAAYSEDGTRLVADTAEGFVYESEDDSVIMSALDVVHPLGEASIAVNTEAKLRAVMGLNRALAGSLGLDDVLPRLLEGVLDIFQHADRGFVLLSDPKSKRLILRAKRFRHGPPDGPVRLSLSLIRKVIESRQAVLSGDVEKDSRFKSSDSMIDCRIRSMMCVPFIGDDGAVLGILQVDSFDSRHGFRPEDLELLVGVAGQASQAVLQAMAHHVAIGQEHLRRDLEIAQRVQQGLLPSKPPEIAGYEVFDFYEPASEIGGDFFGYVPLAEGRLAVVLADVSGKGVSAALVMAALSSDVRYCLASESDPARAVRRINESFFRSGWEDRFATLVVAILDPHHHRLSIVNAGHPPVMLRGSKGGVEAIGVERTGLPIGVISDFEYERSDIDLEPGDTIVLYTDGISEAMDQQHEPYGLPRLRRVLAERGESSVVSLGRRILADVERYSAGQTRSDDMCLVCLGRAEK